MTAKNLDDFLDIQTFVARYSQFTVNQLRWLIYNKEEYGLESTLKRVGRKIYIDVPKFMKWVDKQEA